MQIYKRLNRLIYVITSSFFKTKTFFIKSPNIYIQKLLCHSRLIISRLKIPIPFLQAQLLLIRLTHAFYHSQRHVWLCRSYLRCCGSLWTFTVLPTGLEAISDSWRSENGRYRCWGEGWDWIFTDFREFLAELLWTLFCCSLYCVLGTFFCYI